MKINYPKIEEYNKENYFYNYIENYINQFKNKKDKIELSYLSAKEVLELTKKDKGLYKNCTKGLELVRLWLKDESSINKQELKLTADSIKNFTATFGFFSGFSIYCSVSSIVSLERSTFYSIDSIYYVHKAKSELLPYIQKLIQLYLRKEKQFNIKEHNNTYHEKILKQIINTEYNELSDVDKNQIKDIINEYYDIEIQQMDFLVHKLIYREFIENEKFDNI